MAPGAGVGGGAAAPVVALGRIGAARQQHLYGFLCPRAAAALAALNLERAPFARRPPLELLVEGCAEGGGGWRDKSLGVWRRAELPDPGAG